MRYVITYHDLADIRAPSAGFVAAAVKAATCLLRDMGRVWDHNDILVGIAWMGPDADGAEVKFQIQLLFQSCFIICIIPSVLKGSVGGEAVVTQGAGPDVLLTQPDQALQHQVHERWSLESIGGEEGQWIVVGFGCRALDGIPSIHELSDENACKDLM